MTKSGAGDRAGANSIQSPVYAVRPNLFRRFLRNRGAGAGLLTMTLLVLVSLIGQHLTPYDPFFAVPADQLLSPSALHPVGTDQFGRDVATRLLFGTVLSLQTGLLVVGFDALIGIAIGLPVGFFGGRLDAIVMRGVDVMLAFPSILLALGIVAVIGPSLTNAMIAVGISALPGYIRIVRACTLTTRELPFVESARAIGCRNLRVMARHILPNVLGPIVVVATLGVATAILAAAALSFLGLGAQPPTPEWGAMLNEGRAFMRVAWWLPTLPGAAIMLSVLAINLIGDGLRDALDPRVRL